MSHQMIVRCGGVVTDTIHIGKPLDDLRIRLNGKKVEYTTYSVPTCEDIKKSTSKKLISIIIPFVLAIKASITADNTVALAADTAKNADQIRSGFQQLLEVFTALAEPILWFYALTACILIVTKDKNTGWERLKHVAYAYAGIALLPTFFALLRWVSDMIKDAITI